jgi:hypothetical protein
MEEKTLADIAKLLKDSIVEQLNTPRPVRTYNGQQKTVGGRPVPPSPPRASGNLIKETRVFWDEGFFEGEPELIVSMPSYYFFIEQGRKPGRFPPLSAIDKWVIRKRGLSGIRDERGRFRPRKTQVFLIARSIAEYGFGGTPFLDTAVSKVLPKITEDLGDAAREYFQRALNERRILVIPED